MNTINKIGKVTHGITSAFAYIGVAALIFNVVIIIANVVMRSFGKAIVGTEEMVAMAEVVLIFMALGYTQKTGGLVHVCFFMKKIPGIGSIIMWAINQWAAVAVIVLIILETAKRIPAARQVTTSLLIPFKPFFYVIAIGCAIYGIAQLFEAVKATAAIFNKEIREDVEAHLPA